MTTSETPAAPETQQDADTPPWGDDFKAEKAWRTIQHLRDREKELEKRPVLTEEAKTKLAEYDKITEAAKTDLDKVNESLTRTQAEAEKWRDQFVTAKISALAALDFQFPEDAVNALNASSYLGVDGQINEPAIQQDLAKLLDSRPNWRRQREEDAAQSAVPRLPNPNRSQGTPGSPINDPAVQLQQTIANALNR